MLLLSLTLFLQAYKYIFTLPTSANEVSTDATEDGAQPALKRSKKSLGATRSHIASLIGLHHVTPCSIAYVAVQVYIV